MKLSEIRNNITDIYYTLNQMEIKGDKNIQCMYGVMTVLKQMAEAIDVEEQTEQ